MVEYATRFAGGDAYGPGLLSGLPAVSFNEQPRGFGARPDHIIYGVDSDAIDQSEVR